MTPISSSSIINAIDKVQYASATFRDIFEQQLLDEYNATGHVEPTAGFMYRNTDKKSPEVDFNSMTFREFKMDDEGWHLIRKFNFYFGVPLIMCMIGTTITIRDRLTGRNMKCLVMFLEEPLTVLHKIYVERPSERDPGKKEMVYSPGFSEMAIIPPHFQRFSSIINTGTTININ